MLEVKLMVLGKFAVSYNRYDRHSHCPVHAPCSVALSGCSSRFPTTSVCISVLRSHSPSVQFSSVIQSSPTLCNPMDCSPSGSSVHVISQARKLEWGAIFFSRGSSRPTDRTHISCIGRWVVYCWPTWKARIWGGRPEMLHFCQSPGDRDAACLLTKPWRAGG